MGSRQDRGGRSNGHTSSGQEGPGGEGSGDLYKQLIDSNDMVKELDDIEAISQQISQHAEVLYNSWKSNGLTQPTPQQFKLGSAAAGPSSGWDSGREPPQRAQQNGRQYHSLRTDRDGRVLNREELGQELTNGNYSPHQGFSSLSLERPRVPASDSSSSPRQSTVSSPSSSNRDSPQRGSSITHISHDPANASPLELLASPNLNGNLEDLVSSFVNTDRAKQAARNTISSTIRRRLESNGSSSPVRSPSPTSSPLRSPMMTNMASPTSSASPRSPTSMFNQSEATNRVAVGFGALNSSDIHAPMQSIFSNGPKPSVSSPLRVQPFPSSPSTPSPQQTPFNSTSKTSPQHSFFNSNPKTSPLHIQTNKEPAGDSISIPVKHIPIAVTPSPSPAPTHGLKSASIIKDVSKSPGLRPVGEGMEKMPNFFDELGMPRDPEASLMGMRKRMEEAKQRMALSLPAREGGIRPNSFHSMGTAGSLFDRSPWGDDPSAFLLEQFRRRNKRRTEVPTAPHPELTAQQKQHISDRTDAGGQPNIQQLPRRLLPNGSVAERVMMFEKSPSVFGEVRVPPQRKEPTLSGTVITPWRASAQDLQVSQQ